MGRRTGRSQYGGLDLFLSRTQFCRGLFIYPMYELSPRRILGAFARVLLLLGILAMLLTGFVFLSANVSTPATAFAFHSALEDQGPSPTLAPGATTSYSVRFRNTGLLPWQRGGSAQVNLGVSANTAEIIRAGIAVNWMSGDRIATTAEQVVLPGTLGTFTFTVKAPMTAGIYPLRLRLVADGVTWLEDEDVVTLITVGATAGPPADKPFVTPSATFAFVGSADPSATTPGKSVKVTATVTS